MYFYISVYYDVCIDLLLYNFVHISKHLLYFMYFFFVWFIGFFVNVKLFDVNLQFYIICNLSMSCINIKMYV